MNKDEKKILDNAMNDTIKRVIAVAENADPDRPIDNTDFTLLMIKYTSFLDKGVFKLLRNKIFGYALAISLFLGFTTWAIFNIVIAWMFWRTM